MQEYALEEDTVEITFAKRTKDTTAPYPELNREALALIYDKLEEKYAGKTQEDEVLNTLLKSENFGKLYTYFLEQSIGGEYDQKVIEGVWKDYEEGSDPELLSESLRGYGTGWCIAGRKTAEEYLEKGSVRVYYSNDNEGEPLIPRIAVVEQYDRITEIRGVEEQQHTEICYHVTLYAI